MRTHPSPLRPTATRVFRAVPVLALVGAGILACGGDSGGGERGATVVAGLRSDFSGFNSITNTAIYTTELINYALFTPLVQYDEDLNVRPWLAESWDLEGDTAVVFRLRGDVRWHDGRAVTAEDVEFTFDVAKTPESASLLGSAFLAEVADAEVLDSLTIRFRFNRPHAQALEDFWWAPMPKHLLADVPPAELRNAPFNRNPVGSGPFRLAEWRANERVVLERNPDFPEGLGGPSAAQRVIVRIVPEASTMLTELFTGGIHVDIDVNPDQVPSIDQRGDEVRLHAFPGRTVYYIGWNNARPPFDDVRVRRALALAVDRETIIDALLRGQGSLASSTLPPWHPLHPGDLPALTRDSAAAARLLDQAGWQDRDGDGIRENARGQPLQFTLMSSDDALRRAVVEVLEAQFRRIGARAEVRVLEFQTMLQQHRGREFDAVFTNWVLDNFQVASSPFALFHSSQADVPRSANRSGVRSRRLDALIDAGAAATDTDRQRSIWREFTEVLQDEQPVTFMFWLNELAASREQVQGVVMDPRGEFLSIREWTLGGR
jgi:peptide/nickel transport system substrate-binding protein